MRWLIRVTSAMALALLWMLPAGCGPSTAEVSGKVTYNGKALTGGTIMFTPKASQLNPGVASLDENGHYSLKAPVGECYISVDNRGVGKKVTLIGIGGGETATGKDTASTEKKGGVKDKKTGPIGMPGGGGGGKGGATSPKDAIAAAMKDKVITGKPPPVQAGTYVAIPGKYYRADTSELTYTVKGGSQQHDVELTDK